MKYEHQKTRIADVLALVVFTLFAVCVLSVLLTGAKVYQSLTGRGRAEYDLRTPAQYLTTRVRQADRSGAVSVEDFGGVSALTLREEIGGEVYETRIYCSQGWLWELFAAAGSGLAPEDGEKLMEVQDVTFSWRWPVLTAEVTASDGSRTALTWYLRSGEGAAA